MGLSTDLILNGAANMAALFKPEPGGDHLDIGAGHGDLIAIIRRRFGTTSRACDGTADLMKAADVPVDVVDLNSEKLPYLDATFDLVTCTEVIEHLENFRFVMREAYRVLKPGGIFVVTTPNVLNLTSRIRYFAFGFATLFGPIRFQSRETVDGHISPISYYFLTLALQNAGFADIRTAIDKRQRRGFFWLALYWLPIKIIAAFFYETERRLGTLSATNIPFVRGMNSLDILLGRTVIVGCRK